MRPVWSEEEAPPKTLDLLEVGFPVTVATLPTFAAVARASR